MLNTKWEGRRIPQTLRTLAIAAFGNRGEGVVSIRGLVENPFKK